MKTELATVVQFKQSYSSKIIFTTLFQSELSHNYYIYGLVKNKNKLTGRFSSTLLPIWMCYAVPPATIGLKIWWFVAF